MGELFKVEESPADALLDAIHLMDVHGANPSRAMDMVEGDQPPGEGVKNFTPERMEVQPIPEIENRLDEFFNLESDAMPAAPAPVSPPPAAGDSSDVPEELSELSFEALPDEDPVPGQAENQVQVDPSPSDDGIIPFDADEETVELELSDIPSPDEVDRDDILVSFNKIKQILAAAPLLPDASGLADIRQTLQHIEPLCQSDPVLQAALETMTLMISKTAGNTEPAGISLSQDTEEDAASEEYMEDPLPKKGLWGKISGLFKS